MTVGISNVSTTIHTPNLLSIRSLSLSGGIKELLGSDHPVLERCAKYFFEIDGGKKIRPTMVLAMSYALHAQFHSKGSKGEASPSQKRLAEITEMIHTASLFHDDVIDKVHSQQLPSAVLNFPILILYHISPAPPFSLIFDTNEWQQRVHL